MILSIALALLSQSTVVAAQTASPETRVDFTERQLERILTLSPLPPVPSDPTNRFQDDPKAARLGQAIFFDTRFSRDGSVACATCHIPSEGWADRRDRAFGLGPVERHAPSLWNVVYNRWFFWDGRSDSLWSQALVPFESANEHGISRLGVLHRIHDDPQYRAAFEGVFGALPALEDKARFPSEARPVAEDAQHPHAEAWAAMSEEDRQAVNRAYANVGKAIAAFEARIVSRNAPFDRYVEGLREGDPTKLGALNDMAVRGLQLFVGKAACVLCHNGPNFTDREFHNTRVPPLEGGASTDPGRYRGIRVVQADPFNGMGAYSDEPDGKARIKVAYLYTSGHNWAEIKTPTLRNCAQTAPYMHEGQMASLADVVRFYSSLTEALPTKHFPDALLAPANLVGRESEDLIAFLRSLTDDRIDAALTVAPPSPLLDSPSGTSHSTGGGH